MTSHNHLSFAENDEAVYRRRLVEDNMHIAESAAAKYSGRGIEYDDLLQEAYIGLIQAANRFDGAVNESFSEYAAQRTYGSVKDALRSNNPLTRLEQAALSTFRSEYFSIWQLTGREPTYREVAERLELEDDVIQEIVNYENRQMPARLDAPIDPSSPYGNTFQDQLMAEDEYPQIMQQVFMNHLISSTSRLSERDKEVIFMYYFMGMTLAEVGELEGVTESRAFQIRTVAIKRLAESAIGITLEDALAA